MAKKKDDSDLTPEEQAELEAILPSEIPPVAPKDQGVPSAQDFMHLMKDLVLAMKESQMTPAVMKDILESSGKVTAEMARKAKWPENAEHEHLSVYFTLEDRAKYGDHTKKPVLARDTYFCGSRENEEDLTCAEIEAYNVIDTPRSMRGGAWRAEIKKPTSVGGKEELFIWVPKDTVDQRMVLPSLHLILHELNGGPSTADVFTLIKQIETLKAALAQATGKTTQELEAQLLA